MLLLPIAGLLIHFFYLHTAITEAYKGQPDAFLKFLINTLYPRFEVEKHRFDLLFFIQKSDQVVYRFVFVYYFILLLVYFSNRYESIRNKIQRYFYTKTTSQNIDVLRVLFFSYLIYLSIEICHDLVVLQSVKVFYKPILWLRVLHLPFPGYYAILSIGIFWTLLNILILIRVRIIACSVLSLMLFLLTQSFTFSFEKSDHGYVTLTYAFLLVPFLFDEQKNNSSPFSSWSLQLIRISLALVYFLSALEKLFISGLSWVNPSTLKGYLSLHETSLSKILIQYDALCSLISFLTLTFQLSFILIIFFPNYKWFWIICGILFHYGTLLIMGIGHPLNPWLVTYVFFVDWTKAQFFFSEKTKRFMRSSN